MAGLPSKLAYSTINIDCVDSTTMKLRRRELFDVKLQLMAEDDAETTERVSGLDDTDIRTNVYEGGFKTWECSLDLAKLLTNYNSQAKSSHMLDVGHVLEVF